MQTDLVSKIPAKRTYDVAFLPIRRGDDLAALIRSIDKNMVTEATLDALSAFAAKDGFVGKYQEVLNLPCYQGAPFARLVLFGFGKNLCIPGFRKMGAQASKLLSTLASGRTSEIESASKKNTRTRPISACMLISPVVLKNNPTDGGDKTSKQYADLNQSISAFLQNLEIGAFNFDRYKLNAKTAGSYSNLASLAFTVVAPGFAGSAASALTTRASYIGKAVNMARELVSEPPHEMTPSRLADIAKALAKEHGLSAKILDASQIQKLGMGSFLGVARGAAEPPRLIVLKYVANGTKPRKTIALIGKGITFDSGGLSLKPPVSMEHMKYDMSGAACVLSVMDVVGRLKPKVDVLMVVPACENMPGSRALHPGDVLRSMNGKTIEVNNTDAEGRLVLADAITYAIKEGADELIDIATLTGAVVTALGRACAGIMGSDQNLIDKIIKSGTDCGEKFWQLPLFEEYKDYLKSDVADLKNAGSRGEAGSSAAGMFLKEFVDGKPWAHLDVAGVSWLDREKDELGKGGTGFGVRTLSSYLLDLN
ncbi:MAG: leucyl aminopeptidase [Candidatus Melainabacteria bacterium]|nr:leucyl aminopeptidase [Candidatus Melainabacteria bacterium]